MSLIDKLKNSISTLLTSKKLEADKVGTMVRPRNEQYKFDEGDLILYHLADRVALEQIISDKGRLEYEGPIHLVSDRCKTNNTVTYKGCIDSCLIEVPLSKVRTIPEEERRMILKDKFPYVEDVFVSYLETDMFEISRDNFDKH